MLAEKKELIVHELEEGTGAEIGAEIDQSGARAALRVWFEDLDLHHGPVAELRPFGLRGHRIDLRFGRSAGLLIRQMQQASEEDVQLARALVASIRPEVQLDFAGQELASWKVSEPGFHLSAVLRDQPQPLSDAALVATCRDVLVPLMAAMAELIGYDVVETGSFLSEPEAHYEGALLQSTVSRRERNPRNRLLCLRLHGERCVVCEMDPRRLYGVAGGIIQVHHLQPLSSSEGARLYDPRTDLVPLCPSCHSAAHTRRPVPLTPLELRELINRGVE